MGEVKMIEEDNLIGIDIHPKEERVEVPPEVAYRIKALWEETKVMMRETFEGITKHTDRKKRGGGRNRNTIKQPSSTLIHLLGKMK